MVRRTSRRAAALLLALSLPIVAGCASPERTDPPVSSSSEETQEPAIASAVAAASPNITATQADRVRSGLGTNLYVDFTTAADEVTAAELESVLRAIAPLVPKDMGVVRVTARDSADRRIPLAQPAQELGLPELSIKSGFITLSPVALAEQYAQ